MPLHVKTGDLVVVTAGNYRGETGEILTVDRKAMRVIVKGVNVRKRNMKPNQQQPKGFVVEKELSIHISNVSPVVDGKPSRVRFVTKPDGSKVRLAARNNSELHVLRRATKSKTKTKS